MAQVAQKKNIAKNNDKNTDTSNKSRKMLIIALILLFIVATIIAIFTFTGRNELSTKILTIPTVEVGVISSTDNELHTVKAEFVVEVLGDGKGVSVNDVQSKISNLMAHLDYDKMTMTGSTSYIVSNLEYQLAEYFDDVKITGLFISELGYDGVNVSSGTSNVVPSSESKRSETMKGLFQGIE